MCAPNGRIPDLFRTVQGLPGHVQQLQAEINRVTKIPRRFQNDKEVSQKAIQVQERIYQAVKSVKRTSGHDDEYLSLTFGLLPGKSL